MEFYIFFLKIIEDKKSETPLFFFSQLVIIDSCINNSNVYFLSFQSSVLRSRSGHGTEKGYLGKLWDFEYAPILLFGSIIVITLFINSIFLGKKSLMFKSLLS